MAGENVDRAWLDEWEQLPPCHCGRMSGACQCHRLIDAELLAVWAARDLARLDDDQARAILAARKAKALARVAALVADPLATMRIRGGVTVARRRLPFARPRRRAPRFSLPRAEAIPGRLCAQCGDLIDPADWCPGCIGKSEPCRTPHRRLRKRADAAFCNAACKSEHRASFARDCLPLRIRGV